MTTIADSSVPVIDDHLKSVLYQLKCQFGENVPVRRMRWQNHLPDGIDIDPVLQNLVLNATIRNPVYRDFPPSLAYQRSFMKEFINMLERSACDICDDVYEIYTELMERAEDEDDTLSYKTYYLPDCSISLLESVYLISRGTTGLSTWQAAQYLSEWCLENDQIFRNKKVLELGCGMGLTGLTICKSSSPSSYFFSDDNSQVLFLLAKNLEHNISQAKGHDSVNLNHSDSVTMKKIRRQLSQNADTMARELGCLIPPPHGLDEIRDARGGGELELSEKHWKKESSRPGQIANLRSDPRVSLLHLNWDYVSSGLVSFVKPDIILAADVVYDSRVVPFLVSSLSKIMKLSSCVAYIASTVRSDETYEIFVNTLAKSGLKYEKLPPPQNQIFHYDVSIPMEIIKVRS